MKINLDIPALLLKPKNGLAELLKVPLLKNGAMVHIHDANLADGAKIGFGVAQFLANIPAEGIIPKSHQKDWIDNYLLKYNLVQETEPGSRTYVRTDTANKATYEVIRCDRIEPLKKIIF